MELTVSYNKKMDWLLIYVTCCGRENSTIKETR